MASRGLAAIHFRYAPLKISGGAQLLSLLLLPLLPACMRTSVTDPAMASREELAMLHPVVVLRTPPAVLAEASDSATRTAFRNVDFHMTSDVVLHIHYLDGAMRSIGDGQPVVFDDKSSFVIDIDTAQVGLDPTNLANLMNHHVFGYQGAPLKRLHFAVKGDRLVQSGVLHKVVDIPFEITAALSVTTEGKIRIHPTGMKIFGVDGMGLMKALGIELDALLDLRQAKGVSAEGNDLLLQPDMLLPPPAITGRVVAVRIEGGELVQLFGRGVGDTSLAATPLSPLDSAAVNYMRFSGGTLRFGKLFMVHADMQIIDTDPDDPFDFSIDEYNRQLVAGFSKNTLDGGLKVYMPDLGDVGAALSN